MIFVFLFMDFSLGPSGQSPVQIKANYPDVKAGVI